MPASESATVRVVNAIGRPTLTMVVDPSEDRHFLLELTLVGAAWWLVGKYLDGLVGEPAIKLGERHREAIRATVTGTMSILKEFFRLNRELNADEVALHVDTIAREIEVLRPLVSYEGGSPTGRQAVIHELVAAGLPPGEAERLAKKLERSIWSGPDAR